MKIKKITKIKIKIDKMKNKIKLNIINKHKINNKAFGKKLKNEKTNLEKQTHNRGSPPQTAWYWIASKQILTIGYHPSNQRQTLYGCV